MYHNILSPSGRPVKQLLVAHKKSQSPGASGRALSAHPAVNEIITHTHSVTPDMVQSDINTIKPGKYF